MSLKVTTVQHLNYGAIDIAARKVNGPRVNEVVSNTRNRQGAIQPNEGEREGRRQIGVFSATFITFNRMIGAGRVAN